MGTGGERQYGLGPSSGESGDSDLQPLFQLEPALRWMVVSNISGAESKQPRLLSGWRLLCWSPGLPLRTWREPQQTAQSLALALINLTLINWPKAPPILLSRILDKRLS